jgi:hypothetical protein
VRRKSIALRMLVAAGCCALIAAAHAGCSAFGEESAEDAGAADSATGSDAAPSDGAPRDAATSDAGSFCQRKPDAGTQIYCRDFDDDASINSGWTFNDTVFRDLNEQVSPPASLLARLAPDSGDCAYARAVKQLDAVTSHVRVQLGVRLGETDSLPDESVVYLLVSLGGGAGGCGLIFIKDSPVSLLNEQIDRGDAGLESLVHTFESAVPGPRHGVWTNVELEVDRATGKLEVRFDGVSAFTDPQTLDPQCLGAGTVALYLGLHCEKTITAPKAVRFDNVSVVAIP